MLSTKKTRNENSMISVQTQIEIQGDLSLTKISQELQALNFPKEILKAAIIKLQDELVLDLCGPKYQRNLKSQYTRAGNTNRTLNTRHGKITFKLAKLYSIENSNIIRPLLLYVGIEPKKRVIDDLTLECAETATYLTYRDSKTIIENLTHAKVSKDRIHVCVQKVGDFMNQTRRNPLDTSAATVTGKEADVRVVDLLIGDGTKVHGYDGKKNEVNVILGKNEVTGEKELLGFGVNESWRETALQFKGKAKVAVSDNEVSLRKVLLEKSDDYQTCVLHCVRDVKFY
jgi:transposase-like protein